MEENLETLYARLSLVEDEKYKIFTDDVIPSNFDLSSSLIGKILAPRTISFDQIVSLFKRLWNPKGILSCKPLEDNTVIFTFENLADKIRVQKGSPWLLDKCLMLLENATPDMVISKLSFSVCPFWIQLHGLPLALLNKNFASLAGNSIGHFLEVDTDIFGSVIGRYLRIRVEININKPLRRILQIDYKGKNLRILLKYERLPELCFYCGLIGHTFKDCDSQILNSTMPKDHFDYGIWLRASLSSNPFTSHRSNPRSSDNNNHTKNPKTPSSSNLSLHSQHPQQQVEDPTPLHDSSLSPQITPSQSHTPRDIIIYAPPITSLPHMTLIKDPLMADNVAPNATLFPSISNETTNTASENLISSPTPSPIYRLISNPSHSVLIPNNTHLSILPETTPTHTSSLPPSYSLIIPNNIHSPISPESTVTHSSSNPPSVPPLSPFFLMSQCIWTRLLERLPASFSESKVELLPINFLLPMQLAFLLNAS